ncbi:MAG: nicotinate (nicotinamide) nucleotide adenylyltransferase, partial [Clostridia bacterium]|nr:nicotinate (nicotinamide) nucleotide adenylyltransferase [Clostridia bacterium]
MVKKIVIFGGTFDPPHIEHINMAKACDDELSPDLFIVIPTFEPPHKRTLFCASPSERLEMCRLSFSGMKNVVISDYEIQNEGKSYTYLTVEHFAEVYPCADIYFLLGTDMLTSFDKWKFPDRILKKVKL